MSILQLKNIWKTYGDNVVLENINLNVEEGEFVTIVGASGCGKSTFLRLLLGEEKASRGEIRLDDAPMLDEPHQDRGIVFQRYSAFPHLNALQNVMLGLELAASPVTAKLFGQRKRQAQEEARSMLESVGLGHHADRYPSELSGGMQQRLAIAQSLMMRPRILLLDEPFGALDPGIRSDMHELITKIWQETGVTIFMITHDLKEGFSLGTRLLVFDKRRVDPQAPNAYGANITYDLPLNHSYQAPPEINEAISNTERKQDALNLQ